MILILCILAYIVVGFFATKLYLKLRQMVFNYTDIEPLYGGMFVLLWPALIIVIIAELLGWLLQK